MFKSNNHHGQNLFTSTIYTSYNYNTKMVLLHQVYSLSETKMQRYKVPQKPSQGYIPMATIIISTTKVDHPFHGEENNLSKYTVNFSGCC